MDKELPELNDVHNRDWREIGKLLLRCIDDGNYADANVAAQEICRRIEEVADSTNNLNAHVRALTERMDGQALINESIMDCAEENAVLRAEVEKWKERWLKETKEPERLSEIIASLEAENAAMRKVLGAVETEIADIDEMISDLTEQLENEERSTWPPHTREEMCERTRKRLENERIRRSAFIVIEAALEARKEPK